MKLFKSITKYKNKIKNTELKVSELEQQVFDVKHKVTQLEYQIKYSAIENRLEKNKHLYQKYIPSSPIFTFCMPTYNGQTYIARALESILMQETMYNFKIWIIDDCSTDNTVKIIEEYAKQYPDRFIIDVNEQNERGRTMSPKIMNKVQTKYWMNFDQDDYWLVKDRLQRIIEFMEIHPEVTLYASNLYIKHGSKLSPASNRKENFFFNFYEYPHPLGILMQTSSAVYRNVFTQEDLDHINSYRDTEKFYCICGDTFRNIFALSKGLGYYDASIDSVYNWTETGTWSKYNIGQQNFYDLQYFYNSIDFFKEKEKQNHMKDIAHYYLKAVTPYKDLLNENEYQEYITIKQNLENE